MTKTAARDFTAEFIAAREDSRREGATMTERYDAQDRAAKIARAAARKGIELDEIALDEQARLNLYGR